MNTKKQYRQVQPSVQQLGAVGAIAGAVAGLAQVGVSIMMAVSENKRQNQRLKKDLELQDEQIKILKGQQRLQEGQIQAQQVQLERARHDLAEYKAAIEAAKADRAKAKYAEAWLPWVGVFAAHEQILKSIGSAFGAFELLITRVLPPTAITDTIKQQLDFVIAQAARSYGTQRAEEIPVSLRAMLTELPTRDFTNREAKARTLRQLEYLKDGTFTLGKIYDIIVAEGGVNKHNRAIQFGLFAINTNNDFSQVDYAPTDDVQPVPVRIAYRDIAGTVSYEQVRDARLRLFNLSKARIRNISDIETDISTKEREKERNKGAINAHSAKIADYKNNYLGRAYELRDIRYRRISKRGIKGHGKNLNWIVYDKGWRGGAQWQAVESFIGNADDIYSKLGSNNLRELYDGRLNAKIGEWEAQVSTWEREKREWESYDRSLGGEIGRLRAEKTQAVLYGRTLREATANYFGLHKKFFGDSYFYPVFINQQQFEQDISNEQLLGVTDIELESGKRARRLYYALHRIVRPLYDQIISKFAEFKDYSNGLTTAAQLFRNESEIKQVVKSLLVTDASQPQNYQTVSLFLNSLNDAVTKTKVDFAFKQENIPALLQALDDANLQHIASLFLEFLSNKVLTKHSYSLYNANNSNEVLAGGMKSMIEGIWQRLQADFSTNFTNYVLEANNIKEKTGTWGEQYYAVLERLKIANPLGLFNVEDLDFASSFVEFLNAKESQTLKLSTVQDQVEQLKSLNLIKDIRQEGLLVVVPALANLEGNDKIRATVQTYAKLLELAAQSIIPVANEVSNEILNQVPNEVSNDIPNQVPVPNQVSNEVSAEPVIPVVNKGLAPEKVEPQSEQPMLKATRAGFKFSWLLLAGAVGLLLFNRKGK